jgi:hypothetical protein
MRRSVVEVDPGWSSLALMAACDVRPCACSRLLSFTVSIVQCGDGACSRWVAKLHQNQQMRLTRQAEIIPFLIFQRCRKARQ